MTPQQPFKLGANTDKVTKCALDDDFKDYSFAQHAKAFLYIKNKLEAYITQIERRYNK